MYHQIYLVCACMFKTAMSHSLIWLTRFPPVQINFLPSNWLVLLRVFKSWLSVSQFISNIWLSSLLLTWQKLAHGPQLALGLASVPTHDCSSHTETCWLPVTQQHSFFYRIFLQKENYLISTKITKAYHWKSNSRDLKYASCYTLMLTFNSHTIFCTSLLNQPNQLQIPAKGTEN